MLRTSLLNLGKAVRGLALMSGELEGIGSALAAGKVPAAWLRRSFPSLKPLGSYVQVDRSGGGRGADRLPAIKLPVVLCILMAGPTATLHGVSTHCIRSCHYCPDASLLQEVLARVAFFQEWVDVGQPAVFWVSGFFFTQVCRR